MQQPELAPLAAPVPAMAVRRQPIIQLRMEDVAEELRQQKAAQQQQAGGRAPARATPESLLRCFSFCRFFWTCAAGALHSLVRRRPGGAAALPACLPACPPVQDVLLESLGCAPPLPA